MKNHDESVKTNHKLNWSHIPEHPLANHSWSLSNPDSGAGKTYVILNLIKYQRLDVGKNLFVHQKCIWIKVSITYQR